MKRNTALALPFVLVALIGCTRPNPAATCDDGTCSDPAFAFCDSDGSVGGTAGACIAVECEPSTFAMCRGAEALTCNANGNSYDVFECPNGCGAGGCLPFCTADEKLACEGDQLAVCGPGGSSTIEETCPLGCAPSEPRCLEFQPSNGLGQALADSRGETDVVLPMGSRIDTDLGLVKDANGNDIAVKTSIVPQVGAPAIFVLRAKSLRVDATTVIGTRALALVAHDQVDIVGRLSIRATGTLAAPGAQEPPAACVGPSRDQYQAIGGIANQGAAGAANNDQGGHGGGNLDYGGAAQTSYSPLAGGCRGGSIMDMTGLTTMSRGGGGGGAVQIVARSKIVLGAQGLVDVGAGGGQSSAGGGSGGTVVLEAPEVTIAGAGAGVTANGGAGGGCGGGMGADALANTTAAAGLMCSFFFSGNGGTGGGLPGNGCTVTVDCAMGDPAPKYGGGGGSVGRMRVATKPGGFSTVTPLLSVQVTSATLAIQ